MLTYFTAYATICLFSVVLEHALDRVSSEWFVTRARNVNRFGLGAAAVICFAMGIYGYG